MKRIHIHNNEVGFVIKNKAVVRVLVAGKYWLGFQEQCERFDLSKPFQTPYDFDVLLQIEGFAALVELVEVADHEICLLFVNQNFKQVLAAGRHVFWKGLLQYRFQKEDLRTTVIPASVPKELLEKQALAYYVRSFKLEPSERALLFEDSVFKELLDPGTYHFWKNARSIAISKVDMRLMNLEILGQEILTKDKAQIRINFSVQYQVMDIVKAVLENKEFEKQIYLLMQLALRAYIGNLTLDELMENKAEISAYIQAETRAQVDMLGLKVFHSGIKDIILPGDIREIMNQVLVAEKRAQANIISRREETAATRSLLNTAKLMEENAMLFKLKEMEYVEKIAEKINNISVSGNGQVVDQLKQLFVK